MKLIESDIYTQDIKRALEKTDLSSLSGKTVAVTGGLGLIGSAVVDILIKSKYPEMIIVCARNREKFEERYGAIPGVVFNQYDALKEISFIKKPDYIIHSAGSASPELYVSAPTETILSNFQGVLNLLEYSKNNDVARLLYISSSEVYGRKETPEAFSEGTYGIIDIDDIRSSYPVGKRASEMLCRSYTAEYGVNTVTVRPGHIYGPTASPKDRRISTDFAYKAAKGEELIMKSTGLQKRSYCYCVDCAAQILTALILGESGQAYNIGHDEVTTIRDMAKIYAKAGGVSLSIAEPTQEELKAFNPMNNSSLDNKKIKTLGYSDSFTAEEGLTHTVMILKEIAEI